MADNPDPTDSDTGADSGTGSVILTPLGLDALDRLPPTAQPLAGSSRGFSSVEVRIWDGRALVLSETVTADALLPWAAAQVPGHAGAIEKTLARLTGKRAAFAGLDMGRSAIMGVVNVTPDSFSDGGDHLDPARAIDAGLAMREAGADILDIGGESTRPGAEPVSLQEELDRVLPVIEGLAKAGVRVSIDTRHAAVMSAAAQAGAAIINDVTALRGEPESLQAAAESGLPVMLMHMQGEPQTMQDNPHYEDCLSEVYAFLEQRVAAAEAAGIARERIAVDPGIGFGKTLEHNLELLRGLGAFHGLGCPILLGVSRKRFIGRLSRNEEAKQRGPGSIACALTGRSRAAQIFRVHDVAETRQAMTLFSVVEGLEPPSAE